MLRDRYSPAFNSSPKPLLLDSTFPHAHIYRVYSSSLPLNLSIPPPHGRGKSVSVAYVAGIECIRSRRSRYQSLLPNGRGKSVYVAYVAGGLSTCPTLRLRSIRSIRSMLRSIRSIRSRRTLNVGHVMPAVSITPQNNFYRLFATLKRHWGEAGEAGQGGGWRMPPHTRA